MSGHFEIIRVPGLAEVRPVTWTVLQYDASGKCLGGDSHWLSEEAAQKARTVYHYHPPAHGDTEETIRRLYYVITGKEF
jgi:hypothetical protein